MNSNELYQSLIYSNGSNQLQRMIAALHPTFASIDDRGFKELLTEIYQLAKSINFYNQSGLVLGNWAPFFGELLQDILTGDMQSEESIRLVLDTKRNFTPQFALLLALIKIRSLLQTDINAFTSKHLNFYYSKLLGQEIRPALPDTAFLVFELARNQDEFRLEKGVALDAGKDKLGNKLIYKTNREIIIRKANVSSVKSLFVESVLGLGSKVWVGDLPDLAIRQKTPPTDPNKTWSLFGIPQETTFPKDRALTFGRIGFALGSFLFSMREGKRTVTVNLTSDNATPGTFSSFELKNDLNIQFSGEKEWISPQVESIKMEEFNGNNPISGQPGHYSILEFKLSFTVDQPAITSYQERQLQSGYSTTQPLMEVTLKPTSWKYDLLKNFSVINANIKIDVKGLRTFNIQNDDGLFESSSPFNFFGAQPSNGSECYFLSREIFFKKLQHLEFNLEWKNPPSNFPEYYKGWSNTPITASLFQSNLDFIANLTAIHIPDSFALFELEEGKTKKQSLITVHEDTLEEIYQNWETPSQNDLPNSDMEINPRKGMALRFNLITLQNMPFEAFGHRDFPIVLAKQAARLVSDPGNPNIVLPQPPYTPLIQSISIDYVAEETLSMQSSLNNYEFIQIMPFGSNKVQAYQAKLAPFLPPVGHLYLGISNFSTPGILPVLFALMSGKSANYNAAFAETAQGGIQWSYLSEEEWKSFPTDAILVDQTKSMQKTGLIDFTITETPQSNHSSMPSGQFWIRGVVEKDFGLTSLATSVLAQAVDATLEPDSSGSYDIFNDHLSTGLGVNTIKKFVKPLPAVKSIQQPLPSVDGRPSEALDLFFTRTSERLRHKNRAISAWDFERLVLEQFPDVFKVKVLPAGTSPGWQIGQVDLIVIPKGGDGNLKPLASEFKLNEISQFLTNLTNGHTKIKVSPPTYEYISLDFKVKFLPGFDPGLYYKTLNAELVRYLSPWAFSDQADINFEAKILRSNLMYFIETRSYVDVLTDFKMFHLHNTRLNHLDAIGKMKIGQGFVVNAPRKPTIGGIAIGKNFIVGEDVEIAFATTPASVLVSEPVHRIQILSEKEVCAGISDFGIGNMTVGFDFKVSASL